MSRSHRPPGQGRRENLSLWQDAGKTPKVKESRQHGFNAGDQRAWDAEGLRDGMLKLVSYTFVFLDYDTLKSAEFDKWVIPREFLLLRWSEEKYREVLAYNVAGKGVGAPVAGAGSKDAVTDGSGGLRAGVPRSAERGD